jgi:hypothetical protein
MRWVLAALAWVIAAAVLAPVCFYGVVFLAGPHSSVLPSVLQPPVLLVGWALFLAGPALAARAVWRRARRV